MIGMGICFYKKLKFNQLQMPIFGLKPKGRSFKTKRVFLGEKRKH